MDLDSYQRLHKEKQTPRSQKKNLQKRRKRPKKKTKISQIIRK